MSSMNHRMTYLFIEQNRAFDQNFYTNSQQYLVTVNQVNIHTRNTLFSAVLQNK